MSWQASKQDMAIVLEEAKKSKRASEKLRRPKMMKVNLKTEDYVPVDLSIVFYRTQPNKRREINGKELIDTYCRVFRNGQLIAQTIAYQNWRDRYNKIVGRKVALAKAIKQLGFLAWIPGHPRIHQYRYEMRRHLWETFQKTFGRWN